MPIIEGEYEMLADRRELFDELQQARAQTWKLHGQLSKTELELAAAEVRASYWAALCVVLLIAAGLLAAFLALAT